MAGPSYTEDLTDIDLANSLTGWAESTVTAWKDGGAPTTDTDYPFIQGTVAISQQATKNTYCSLLYNNGSGITIPTDGAILVWQVFSSPSALQTVASGGQMALVGSSLADFNIWYIGGSDYGRNPYGGWANFAFNTAITADTSVGTPGTTQQYIGAACNLTAGIGKGNPHAVDAIRYGRCSSIYEFGDATSGYCTFNGYATKNDYNDATNGYNRWGLMQSIDGGYLYKGKMTLGTATNAVDFRDSDANILIDDTPKCTANFNTIEVNHASSRVDWDNVKFTALGTQSPGRLVVNANADLNWDSCQFTGMGAFSFGGSNSACTNAIWQGCGQVTYDECDLDGSSIKAPTVAADEGALYVNETIATSTTLTKLDNMSFTQGSNAHHAIRFGTGVTANITLNNMDFAGFGTNDDTNGSVFRFDATTGSLTLSLVGCSHDGSGFTIDDAAGITVTVSIDPVTTLVQVFDHNGDELNGARVYLEAANATGDLPYNASITSISRTLTTATVTFAAAHNMNTGEYLNLAGITDKTEDNYGAHQVTYSSPTVVTYQTTNDGSTSYTGTITGTGATIHGLTTGAGADAGKISTQRSYTSPQPLTGRIRMSSSSPRYKSFPISGTVSTTAGLTITAQLILDE